MWQPCFSSHKRKETLKQQHVFIISWLLETKYWRLQHENEFTQTLAYESTWLQKKSIPAYFNAKPKHVKLHHFFLESLRAMRDLVTSDIKRKMSCNRTAWNFRRLPSLFYTPLIFQACSYTCCPVLNYNHSTKQSLVWLLSIFDSRKFFGQLFKSHVLKWF